MIARVHCCALSTDSAVKKLQSVDIASLPMWPDVLNRVSVSNQECVRGKGKDVQCNFADREHSTLSRNFCMSSTATSVQVSMDSMCAQCSHIRSSIEHCCSPSCSRTYAGLLLSANSNFLCTCHDGKTGNKGKQSSSARVVCARCNASAISCRSTSAIWYLFISFVRSHCSITGSPSCGSPSGCAISAQCFAASAR